MSTSYPSDLSTNEFELIASFLPAAKPGGRPRTTDLWLVLNAIFYVLPTTAETMLYLAMIRNMRRRLA